MTSKASGSLVQLLVFWSLETPIEYVFPLCYSSFFFGHSDGIKSWWEFATAPCFLVNYDTY
jgi:hypothetical protein